LLCKHAANSDKSPPFRLPLADFHSYFSLVQGG
jgi:hypothetical protein